jgi:hypothetical protein
MKQIKLLIISLICLTANTIFSQEGLAPLQGNEKLQWETKQYSRNPEAGETYTYQFKLDTNHLPIVDDFSRNYFKSYMFDTLNAVTDTLVWQRFLVNNVYQEELKAMFDTSYHYTYNGTGYDSVANPVIYVTNLSQIDYQMVLDTDTVWAWDTLVVGNTVSTNHSADKVYLNSSDTVVIVPDEGYTIWRNNNALHNYTYGDKPITLGVVTFDGLDSTGTPYDPTMNPNSYQIADILESKPIYLKTRPSGGNDYNSLVDTGIYLSFFYQPQGLGDAPEAKDSLVLEFYSPYTNKWAHKWSAPGSAVHDFKSVMIHVGDAQYFADGFKFRFLNYASVSGNFDHWNIDYVRLDEKRDVNDTTMDDVGLLDPGKSLIVDYSQMPWSHYKASTSDLMNADQNIRFRNNHSVSKFTSSSFVAYDHGSMIFDGSLEITPILNSFAIGDNSSIIQGTYPKTSADTFYSYNVEYFINSTPDDNRDNDTAFFHQQFGSQYAYDDGSAESAYFVTSAGAQIAVEYKLAVADTLKAVNIYFPKSFENIVDRAYRIMVWKSLDPEEILLESYLYFPTYSGGRDLVQGIELEEPLVVEGTIYIGIKQLDKRIFIGLDKNNNNQTKNFFKVGGQWQNSSYEGSLFIRPEFGTTTPWPVSVENIKKESFDFLIYPNPSSSIMNIEVPSGNYQVILRTILGTIVKTISVQDYAQMSVSDLSSGVYMIEVSNLDTGSTNIKKLLIQH